MSTKSKKMNHKKALAMLGIAAAVAYATPTMLSLNQAHASGGGGGLFGLGREGGSSGFTVNDPITAKECGDCHQPYPASTLPQGSWRRVMGDLSNHFGEDASLNETTRTHIENYLVRNSSPGEGPLRITEQRWFLGAHNGEVSQRDRQQAGSMSRCYVCHRSSNWSPKK